MGPEFRLLLATDEKRLTYPPKETLTDIPAWAKPLIYAAYSRFRLVPPR